MKLPGLVPEIPVRDLDRAVSYYQQSLGFRLDWKYKEELAGLSRDSARIFLRNAGGVSGAVLVWMNLESVASVDVLYEEWKRAGAEISAKPEAKEWGLYEFVASDRDGNFFRVFHDTETPKNIPPTRSDAIAR